MNRKCQFLIVMLMLVGITSLAVAQTVGNVSPREAYEYMQSHEGQYELIDVRTPSEFRDGYIEGAKLMPVASTDFLAMVKKLPKDKTYIIYCRSGNRSQYAKKEMVKYGLSVLHLDGGIRAWKRAGLPIVK